MTDPAKLQKLVTWLSPAFPVGSFAWSAGLETAIAQGIVRDSAALQNWILSALRHGGIKSDAILLAEAHRRAHDGDLGELADLGLALTAARERWLETTITADSYRRAIAHWPTPVVDRLPDPCPYPLVVGAVAAGHDIDIGDTLLAFLSATVHGQISVAVRLVPLGQSDGLRVMAALEPEIAALATTATKGSLADLGGLAYAADIAQMRHETLEPRIFRS